MRQTEFLKSVSIFSSLGESHLERLASGLRRRSYPRGALILSQGDEGRSMYIVESGRVRVHMIDESGRELTAAILSDGDVFGEMALLDGTKRSASVLALEQTSVLALDRESFFDQMRECPEIAVGVIGVLAQRLRATTAHAGDLVFLDVPGRVAQLLVRLADDYGVVGSDGISVELRLTQSEMATMVGATREMVNRALNSLCDAGFLQMEGRRLVITDRERLCARIR